MKIGRTIITIRRELGKTLHDEVDTVLWEILGDPTHELRKLIAHTSRSSAKDFLGTTAEDQLILLATKVWPLLEPRVIEMLKSHTPGQKLDTPAPIDPTKTIANVATLPGNTPLIDPNVGKALDAATGPLANFSDPAKP